MISFFSIQQSYHLNKFKHLINIYNSLYTENLLHFLSQSKKNSTTVNHTIYNCISHVIQHNHPR